MHSHNAIALESLTRNGFTFLASTSELKASQTKHTQGQHIPKVLNLSQARAPPLFIAPKPNRAVGAKYHISARSPDCNVWAPDIGWQCPIVELQWLFQSSCWDPSTGHRGQCTALGVAVPLDEFPPSLEKGAVPHRHGHQTVW